MKKGISLTLVQWKNLVNYLEYLDQALTKNNYNNLLGGNVYCTVTEGMVCMNIRSIGSCILLSTGRIWDGLVWYSPPHYPRSNSFSTRISEQTIEEERMRGGGGVRGGGGNCGESGGSILVFAGGSGNLLYVKVQWYKRERRRSRRGGE